MKLPCTPMQLPYCVSRFCTWITGRALMTTGVVLVAAGSALLRIMPWAHVMTAVQNLAHTAAEDATGFIGQLLLLSHKIADLRTFLCTVVPHVIATTVPHIEALAAGILIAWCVVDLMRYAYISSVAIENLKANIYRVVTNKFSDCTKCGHKNQCSHQSYASLEVVAVMVKSQLGIDFFPLQLEARLALARQVRS